MGLAVIALILLLGMGLIFQQKRTILRLEAREDADSALSETLERLRAGSLPPVSGPIGLVFAPEVADDLVVLALVTPEADVPDLYRARLLARYSVVGEDQTRSVETLVWRP